MAVGPVTMGIPFKEGRAVTGTDFVVTKADGTPIPSQWDELATWRTDGSMLHAALTFLAPDSGDNTGTYRIIEGTPESGTAVTKAEIAALNLDATIELTISGTAYSLNLDDLLDGTVVPTTRFMDHTHLSGPIMSEFAIGGPPRDSGDTEHPQLSCYFYVRGYKNGASVSWVSITYGFEYTGFDSLSPSPASYSVDVDLSLNGSSIRTDTTTVHADTRFFHDAWWPSDPDMYAVVPPSYFQQTKLVDTYRPTQITESYLSGVDQTTAWLGTNGGETSLANTGGRKELAPRERECAAFIVSGDKRAFNAMCRRQEQYGWMNGLDDYGFHYRDEDTGYVPDAKDTDDSGEFYYNRSSRDPWPDDPISFGNEGGAPISTNGSHMPTGAYVPYLSSAKYRWLEQTQMWGVIYIWSYGFHDPPEDGSPPTGHGWPKTMSYYSNSSETRKIAWTWRNAVDAAVCTPDAHPLKSTLEEGMAGTFSDSNTRHPATNDLGVYPVTNYPGGGVATFQINYFSWMVLSARTRGYTELSDTFFEWVNKSLAGRWGADAAVCFHKAGDFSFVVKPTSWLADWAAVYVENYGAPSCNAIGSAMDSGDSSTNNYTAQASAPLALAYDLGLTDMVTAWDHYEQRSKTWPDSDYEDEPEYGMYPYSLRYP